MSNNAEKRRQRSEKIDKMNNFEPILCGFATIVTGGGQQHAECEAALLKNASKQKNIWDADWIPFTQTMAYESIINIRPSQNNRSAIIQDLKIRERFS